MPCKIAKEIPHFSDETICCPALIPGLSHGSGCDPGLNAEAKLAVFPPSPRTIHEGKIRSHLRFPFRVDNGRFGELEVSPPPLLRPEMLCAIPPLPLSREIFLSGNENGRIMRLRAESGL